MQIAFIVKLDLPDATDLAGIAEDMSESLSSDGHSVLSIVPWQRSGLDVSAMDQQYPDATEQPGMVPMVEPALPPSPFQM